MEFVNRGKFCFYSNPVGEEKAKIYGAEMILALDYFHSRGIVYPDRSFEDILLDKDGHIKLTDLDLCEEDTTHGEQLNISII